MAKKDDVTLAQEALQKAGDTQTAAQTRVVQAQNDADRAKAQEELDAATIAVQQAKDGLSAAQGETETTDETGATEGETAQDETVPGGRYKVGGRFVDADGTPIRG